MQSADCGNQKATWINWLVRGLALVMFGLVTLFLVLVAMKVPVREQLRDHYKALSDVKTEITSMLNEVNANGTPATFKSEEDKILLKYKSDRLKSFLEANGLTTDASYKDFTEKVAEVKADWALEDKEYTSLINEIKTPTMTDTVISAAATAMIPVMVEHIENINLEFKPAAAVLQKETGRTIDYTATLAKIGALDESLAAYVQSATPETFETMVNDLVAYRAEFVNAAQSVMDGITVEQDKAAEEHKTLLWFWLIFEVLSLLASAALLTMADMDFFGGNAKVNRAFGFVFFALTAVQLIFIIHFGIF